MNILESIGAGIVSIALFIGGLFGYTQEPQYTPVPESEELGRAVNPVATNNYTIAGSGISSSATTLTLTSFTAPVSGVPYTMANFGEGVNAKGYLTIEPGSRTRQEIVSFTGITQNSDGSATLTGLSRGLLPFSPFTSSTTYAVAHSGGSQVTVSNPPQLYDTIYSYIDNATTSGAVDGTVSAKGIYETATGVEAASTTQIGGGNTTATLALTTLISTSTGGTAYTVPVTNSTGKLDGTFCCSGTTTFTGSVAFNATTTGTLGSTTIRVYTTGTTTWSKPPFLKHIVLEMVGGGGGGGDGINGASGGGGGGAGGYCRLFLTNAQLPATTSVVVGAGGASEINGNASYFTNYATSSPGTGANNDTMGSGGTVSGCTLGITGNAGEDGDSTEDGGNGGASYFGGAGTGGESNTVGGNAATNSGGGGGGGGEGVGGTGGAGIVIITEYF